MPLHSSAKAQRTRLWQHYRKDLSWSSELKRRENSQGIFSGEVITQSILYRLLQNSRTTRALNILSQVLAEELFDTPLQSKVLKFGRPPLQPVTPVGTFQTNLRASYLTNCTAAAAGRRTQRYISQSPERILDAPELVNDFYLNLLDWSCDNILAVGLGAVSACLLRSLRLSSLFSCIAGGCLIVL